MRNRSFRPCASTRYGLLLHEPVEISKSRVRISRSHLWTTLLLVSTVMVCGCGKSEFGTPAAISGLLTLDEKPLAHVQVQFFAVDSLPAKHRMRLATTDDEGRYTMKNVYPATYYVTLTEATTPKADETPSEIVMAYTSENPLKHWSGNDNDIRAEVIEGKTVVDIELKSPGKK